MLIDLAARAVPGVDVPGILAGWPGQDLLNKNVTLHVVPPRRHRAERTRKAWTTDEARAFLESARSDRRASPTSLTLSAYLFLKVTATIYDFAVST